MLKRILPVMAIVGFIFAAQVTFTVDVSQDPTLANDNVIVLQADFDGWWPGIIMDDSDGDLIFTVTVALDAGYYEYKFAGYEYSTVEFPDWSMTEADAGPCLALANCTGANGECQFINRFINVATEDMVVGDVCWDSCDACVEPAGGELTNGGFEDGLNGWGGEHNASWFVDVTGALIYTSEDIFEAYEGTYGLKTWGRFDGVPLNVFSQSFAVDPGAELTFTGFVFTHPDDHMAGDNSAYLSLNWSNAASEDLGSDLSELFTSLFPADVWTELTVAATAPEGATNVEVAINYNQIANADGSVYWDAMNLSAVGGLFVAGCTDETALNYNPDATVDDGTCYYEGDFVNITFNVDFSCEGADPDPFLAGGDTFGNPGDNPMTDLDGDGIYSITVQMLPNTGTDYTFTNGACGDWSCKESIAGQDCATDPWSDRHIDVGEDDVIVNTCFAQCVDGTCGECPDPGTGECLDSQVAVTFYVDLSQNPEVADANTIALMGEFNGWWPGDIMEDFGNYVYGVTLCLGAETDYEYKFAGYEWTISEFPDAEYPVGEPPCPGTTSTVECQYGSCTNRLLTTGAEDMTLDAVYWAGCDTYPFSPTPHITFQVDLSQNPEIATGNTIALQSDFAGWWPGIPMDDSDGDLLYTVTVDLIPGYYEYKFAGYEWSASEFEDWQFTPENAPACLVLDNCTGENGECQFINRSVDVVETVELDPVYWGTCDVIVSVPEVTFQVDLSQNPDITENYTIALQADFAGWWPGIPMNDDDGDLIYTVTVALEPGYYEYKFAGYEWATSEFPDWSVTEADAGDCLFVDNCVGETGECQFINRFINVTDDAVLDEVCWASCDLCTGGEPTYVDVTFQVDMQFTDTSTGVYLAGGTIGSEDSGVPSMGWQMTDDDGDMIYTTTISLLAGSHQNYKFRGGPSYGWEGNWENVPAECGEGAYVDRFLDVGYDAMALDVVCFASCEACGNTDLFVATFNVDMNCSGLEAFTTVYVTGPFLGWCGDCLPLTDDDEDGVWTGTYSFNGNLEYIYEVDSWAFQEDLVDDMAAGGTCAPVTDYDSYANRLMVITEDTETFDTYGSCDACETCGDGDITMDGGVNVGDIVAIVAVILDLSELDPAIALCHGDVNASGTVDILDVVIIVDWILNPRISETEASEAYLVKTDNGLSLMADGYVGGVQIILTHGSDFTINMPSDAFMAEYNTVNNQTTVVVLQPGSELFSSTGDYEIGEVLAASGNHYVNVTLATEFNLLSAYPNPFNPRTNISYMLPQDGFVKLAVYDILGRTVNTLISDYSPAGTYSVVWSGMDNSGMSVPSGIYFIRIQHAGGVANQKIMLLK